MRIKNGVPRLKLLPAACLVTPLLLVGCGVDLKPPEVGDQAPPFTAFAMDGAEMSSEDLAGSPYMLNVWATWCGPCRKEMPDLQRLHDAYSDQGFSVVGVSVDNRSAQGTIEMFLDELDIDFPIFHDPTARVQDTYFLLGLPGTFLIDRNGVITRKWMGPFLPLADDVRRDVEALLGQAAEAQ
ncbi:MAG: peroxiredoxin family protein [Longimicrobiales bacterium]